jgi:3-oxoacyl-[acyl-carrier protein] reductase
MKIALITGGNKGIGFGIAQQFVANGHRVVISSRTQEGLDEAIWALNNIATGMATGVVADVRRRSDLDAMVTCAHEAFGPVDVVIANAGLGHFDSIETLDEARWNETIDVNLTGVYHTIRATIDDLKQTKGYFITIASLAGTNFFAGGAAYNASKFGLVGFTQAVMLDLRKYGIKTTTIMPGSVATNFNNHTPNEQDGWKIQPEDIGQMVIDLLQLPARALPSKIEVRPTMPG